MRCVVIDASGFVVDVDPQPSDFTTCTFVLQSGAEVVASPFALSLEDAGVLSVAFAGLWALAYCIRLLKRQLLEG